MPLPVKYIEIGLWGSRQKARLSILDLVQRHQNPKKFRLGESVFPWYILGVMLEEALKGMAVMIERLRWLAK